MAWCVVCDMSPAVSRDRCIACYHYLLRRGEDRPPELTERQGWLNAKKTLEQLYTSFAARIVRPQDPSGCWLWSGKNTGRYGIFSYGGQQVLAHRFVYQWLVAPIPKTFVIDHLCGNKLCVNPDHLEAVTQRENVQRARAGRQ